MRRWKVRVSFVAVLAVAFVSAVPVNSEEKTEPDPAAVARAKDMVKMLDDLYKTAVVGITKTYVDKQDDTPAAIVAMKVFAAMDEKGYHKTRLIDITGQPMRKENVARSDFEKRAIAKLKAGDAYFGEVGTKDGKPVYRAATLVPAVMKQCVSCHHHVKEGEKLGALIYEVPVK